MRLSVAQRVAVSFPVAQVCSVLGVSRSGYYARLGRGESARVREDRRLKQQILAVHVEARQRYGTPRVERALRRSGTRTSRKRVARLRRELGLRTRDSRRFRVTTDSDHRKPIAPNRLQRSFTSRARDRIWVGDITYLRAGASWLYLAVLLDVYSRRVVGWSLSSRIDEGLVRKALDRALAARRPARGWIHHTDRGGQYCADDYRERVDKLGGVASMSRKGDCWDKGYASHCTSSVGFGSTSRRRRRCESFRPCILTGGSSPRCS